MARTYTWCGFLFSFAQTALEEFVQVAVGLQNAARAHCRANARDSGRNEGAFTMASRRSGMPFAPIRSTCDICTDTHATLPPLQLLRAIGFLNKHGFAHLDIKSENIVLEPLPDDVIDRLFVPLGQAATSDCSDHDEIGLAQRIQVRFTAATNVQPSLRPSFRRIS